MGKTKSFSIELTETIDPIREGDDYDSYWILIRYRHRPVGGFWYSIPDPNWPNISPEEMQVAVISHLGGAVIENVIGGNIIPESHINEYSEPISVIVCTRNRTGHLRQCITSLLDLEYPDFEIIIVDNAPDDDFTAKLAADHPVRYIHEPRPGLDWARNRGITEARHRIVAFTDDDARVDRFWLCSIAESFRDPEVMAVSGLVWPAELETTAQFLFEFDYGGMGHGMKYRKINRERISDRDLFWASSFGIGANMAFRKEIFEKIGMFDASLDAGTPSRGCGDVEMFHRLVASGYIMVYEPSMLVWHVHRRSFGALKQQMRDNGCSFGVYLLTCTEHKTMKRSTMLHSLLRYWFIDWILLRLISPPGNLPRSLVVHEFFGMLESPFAYRATKRKEKEVHNKFSGTD